MSGAGWCGKANAIRPSRRSPDTCCAAGSTPALELLLASNRVRCRPPLDDAEVAQVFASIAQLSGTDEYLGGWFSSRSLLLSCCGNVPHPSRSVPSRREKERRRSIRQQCPGDTAESFFRYPRVTVCPDNDEIGIFALCLSKNNVGD
jgi:hypothetical protein